MNKLWLVSVMVISACGAPKPKAGDACAGNVATCDSAMTALSCFSGVYKAVTCPGAKGCVDSMGKVTCDEGTMKSVGDTCFNAGFGACDPTLKKYLICGPGATWTLQEDCGATGGTCKDDGTTVRCMAAAVPPASCTSPGSGGAQTTCASYQGLDATGFASFQSGCTSPKTFAAALCTRTNAVAGCRKIDGALTIENWFYNDGTGYMTPQEVMAFCDSFGATLVNP